MTPTPYQLYQTTTLSFLVSLAASMEKLYAWLRAARPDPNSPANLRHVPPPLHLPAAILLAGIQFEENLKNLP